MQIARRGLRTVVSDAADLVLGRCCQVCGMSGPELCHVCLADLRAEPNVRLSLFRGAVAATTYAGVGRALILAYKEDGHRSLAGPLGLMLADAVGAVVSDLGSARTTLVPVPGHPRPRRGFDALDGIVRRTCIELGRRGIPAEALRVLRSRVDYPAAKALSREQRRRHLTGAFTVAPAFVRRPAGLAQGSLIVVDDVITTGTTVTEALRALRSAGFVVHGAALIAARQRQPG